MATELPAGLDPSLPGRVAAEPGQHRDAVLGIALAARSLERHMGELTLAQLRILSLIALDPIRASALAERAAMSRPTLSGLIDGLVARGWVERRLVDGDRRGVTLRITGSGSTALDQARSETGEALEALLDCLPKADRPAVLQALGALMEAAYTRHQAKHPAPDHTDSRAGDPAGRPDTTARGR